MNENKLFREKSGRMRNRGYVIALAEGGSVAKKIGQSDIIGEQGIALIRQVVLAMNFMFYETGGVEAGIDGIIELRDEKTGEVSNRLLQVQGKATTLPFSAETKDSFEFGCSEADIEYWRGGTAPVILVVARPADGVAYWKSIRHWFADPDHLKSRKVVFDKKRDAFTKDAKAALIDIANSAAPGSISPIVRKSEELTINLLKASFAKKVYWAPTKYKDNKTFGAALRAIDARAPNEWFVKGGAVTSFNELDGTLWRRVCETGATEEFNTAEWATSDDADRTRDFVQLLNRCLNSLVFPTVRFDKKEGAYYFNKPRERAELNYKYKSVQNETSRRVVGRYGKKKDKAQTSYYRHSGFWGRFVRYDAEWFLEVNPTYHFTIDGVKPSKFQGDLLKKIKEIENNAAVFGQFVMWQNFLTNAGKSDLVRPAYPFLSLEAVPSFALDVGVPDDLWISREEHTTSPLFEAGDSQP